MIAMRCVSIVGILRCASGAVQRMCAPCGLGCVCDCFVIVCTKGNVMHQAALSLQRVRYVGCAVWRWIAVCVVRLLMYDTCVGEV